VLYSKTLVGTCLTHRSYKYSLLYTSQHAKALSSCFLLGYSPASVVQRFGTMCLFHLCSWVAYEDGTKCFKTLAFKLQTPGITQKKAHDIQNMARVWNIEFQIVIWRSLYQKSTRAYTIFLYTNAHTKHCLSHHTLFMHTQFHLIIVSAVNYSIAIQAPGSRPSLYSRMTIIYIMYFFIF
jgi:hypothetical protein